jgi:ATP-dependent helicase IRC3
MLVSPTLWGLSHDDIASDQREKGEEREDVGEEDRSVEVEGVERDKNQMKVSYIDQDDPFRLAKKGDSPLAMMSHNAWVGLSGLVHSN